MDEITQDIDADDSLFDASTFQLERYQLRQLAQTYNPTCQHSQDENSYPTGRYIEVQQGIHFSGLPTPSSGFVGGQSLYSTETSPQAISLHSPVYSPTPPPVNIRNPLIELSNSYSVKPTYIATNTQVTPRLSVLAHVDLSPQHSPTVVKRKDTRGRPKKDTSDKFHWSDEATEPLIDLWKNKPVLFQPTHADYHKRDKKERAPADIKDALVETGIDVDVSDLHSKMTSLKSYYCQQHGTTKASQHLTGQGTENVFVSRWKFYKSLNFLNDTLTPRNTVSTRKSDTLQNSLLQTPKRKKRNDNVAVERVEKLMETAVNALQTTPQPPPTNERKIRGRHIW